MKIRRPSQQPRAWKSSTGNGSLVPSGPRNEGAPWEITDTREQPSAERSSAATLLSRRSRREVGRLDQGEALDLTALVALRDRDRGWRYAVRGIPGLPAVVLRASETGAN